MINIPSKQTKKWAAENQGDLFGNILRPRNLNFNKKGYLSLAGKPKVFYSETDSADFETPICIESDDNTYYIVTSDQAFEITFSGVGASASLMSTGNPPSFGFDSDAVFFNGGELHVSGGTEIGSWSGSTWTQRYSALTSSRPHPLCVSEHQQYLAVGNGNEVRLLAAAGPPYTLQATCTIPSDQYVTWIRWKGNLLYFGTRNIYGGQGRMYIWNGSGTAANAGYPVGSEWAMTGILYEDTIVVISISGQWLRFTGNGFVPLRTKDGREVNFPIYYSGIPWNTGASNSNLLSPVASRGACTRGSRIYAMVDGSNDSESGQLVNFPSGLWVFDPDVGLYHKAGVDHKTQATLQPSSRSGNTLTLPSAQVFETGDLVFVESQNGITGIVDNRAYYAIKVSTTQIQLARTAAEAVAGSAITLGGTPDVFDLITFNKYQSVGATVLERSGPVHPVSRLSIPEFHADEVIFASETKNSVGTTIGVLLTLGMGKNVGSFMTPWVEANAVKDLFQKLVAKFSPMNISSRKIIVKYRLARRAGTPGRRDALTAGSATASWVNATSFTIDPTQYDAYAMAEGDEIEFIQGAAAGYTAHVVSINKAASPWTVTIDESMPDVAASDKSDFFFDNFTKYKTISTADDAKAAAQGLKKMVLVKKAKRIQLKIELRGYADIDGFSGRDSVDLEEISVINIDDLKYN